MRKSLVPLRTRRDERSSRSPPLSAAGRSRARGRGTARVGGTQPRGGHGAGIRRGGRGHRCDARCDAGARGWRRHWRAVLDSAPTLAVYRHLWRSLSRLARGARGASDGLAVTLFAIPVVIIAAPFGRHRDGDAAVRGRSRRRCARRRAARARRAVRQPIVRARKCARDGRCDRRGAAPRAACLKCARGGARSRWHSRRRRSRCRPAKGAHLRFLVGSALAAPGADLLRDTSVGAWGMPLAKSLIAQLSAPAVSIVALPRAAMSLPAAVALGRAAQREVSAQLFASNALREMRASVGEPVAVISAHEARGGARGRRAAVIAVLAVFAARCAGLPLSALSGRAGRRCRDDARGPASRLPRRRRSRAVGRACRSRAG